MEAAEQKKNEMELLAPAGSMETFRAVLRAGADAVYLGGNRFGARAYADNFTEDELLRAIDEAHIHGRRVYLTVNTLLKEDELEKELYRYLLPFYRQGLDAVIVQDVGALSLIRDEFPGMRIHASTQMTVTGTEGASYMKALGADRIVTARELSLAEIQEIHENVDIEIESFVHGALCYSYSGQCLFSSLLGGRSGNRGRCAQPCRLPYEVLYSGKKKRRGTGLYPLSPKDLCAIGYIPQLAAAGVCSFKIEGRMKQAEYAAGTVSVYRDYLDRFREQLQAAHSPAATGREAPEAAAGACQISDADKKKLSALGNRSGFTDGYYFRKNGKEMITFGKPNHTRENEELQREIREKYIRPGAPETELKEKIKGILRLKKDFPATIELSCHGYTVSESGETVQAAKSQPLSLEKIETALKKTGGTPFEFGELIIEAEEDLFLPVQALNSLRRDALGKLQNGLTAAFRRNPGKTMDTRTPGNRSAQKAAAAAQTNLAVSVERRRQLAPALAYGFVDDIYLDSGAYMRENLLKELADDVAAVHRSGRRACYILPAIFRSGTSAFYRKIAEKICALGIDGVVVKSFDSAWFARETFCGKLPLIADHSLYTYNNRAKRVFAELPVQRDTAPLELNRRELARRDNRGSEMMIYGYLPLMTSAQCIRANTGQCDRQASTLYLKDRYGMYFPVRNHCGDCYNVIYNSSPLALFDAAEELKSMGMTAYRISFTIEDEKQVRSVLHLYQKTFLSKETFRPGDLFFSGANAAAGTKGERERMTGTYTRGHYKRGVE